MSLTQRENMSHHTNCINGISNRQSSQQIAKIGENKGKGALEATLTKDFCLRTKII